MIVLEHLFQLEFLLKPSEICDKLIILKIMYIYESTQIPNPLVCKVLKLVFKYHFHARNGHIYRF